MTTDQSARDDAIVLAALPAGIFTLRFALAFRTSGRSEKSIARRTREALERLKRANLARYVLETKRWETTP